MRGPISRIVARMFWPLFMLIDCVPIGLICRPRLLPAHFNDPEYLFDVGAKYRYRAVGTNLVLDAHIAQRADLCITALCMRQLD